MTKDKDTDTVHMFCDKCEHKFDIEIVYASDLFQAEIRCPKCKSLDTWVMDIDCDRSGELVMGRGGCRQK